MVLDGKVLLVDTAGNVIMQMGDDNSEVVSDEDSSAINGNSKHATILEYVC